jgi:UDP-N-acetyl-D-glucosamine dehydrogenase
LERLAKKGARITYHDPHVPQVSIGGETLLSQPLDDAIIAAQDCVVILTPHPGIDVRALIREAPLVFDSRGATMGIDAPNVVRL